MASLDIEVNACLLRIVYKNDTGGSIYKMANIERKET